MLPVRFDPHRELFFLGGEGHSETVSMRCNIVTSASDFLKTFAGTPANAKANAAGLAGLPQTSR